MKPLRSLLNIVFAFSLVSFIMPQYIHAQSAEKIESVRGVALVIGNAAYKKTTPLANPGNDARDVADAMEKLGWKVLCYNDASLAQMRTAVREFASALKGQKAGFFFYAGHGLQVDGINYLVPVDADIKLKSEVPEVAMKNDFVLQTMDEVGVPLKIVVLDACRDNPFESTRSTGGTRGLAVQATAPSGTVIVYATAPNDVSQDGPGRNGVFTEAFLENLGAPGLEFREVFDKTGESVRKRTSGAQNPWMNSSYYGKLYFVSPQEAERQASQRLGQVQEELATLQKEQAARDAAIAAAKSAVERDRLTLESRKATALEAAKKTEAEALERAKSLATARIAEEERNRSDAAARAREAEVQLVLLRKQAEERRTLMGSVLDTDAMANYYIKLRQHEFAIKEVRDRFKENLAQRIVALDESLDKRLQEIETYKKEPWESPTELEERKAEAMALIRRDHEREVASLRASYSKSEEAEVKGLQKELDALTATIAKKQWTVPLESMSLARSDFDDVNKSWIFSLSCKEPIFNTEITVKVPHTNRDELRENYIALDNTWQAGAMVPQVVMILRHDEVIGRWVGQVVSASILDVGTKDKVIAKVTIPSLIFAPPKPTLTPAKLVISDLPDVGTLSLDEKTIEADGTGKTVEVSPLEELSLRWMNIPGVFFDNPSKTLILEEGEIRPLNLHYGKLQIPWLPDNPKLFMGTELYKGDIPEGGVFKLVPGTYTIKVLGDISYDTSVRIVADRTITLPGYMEEAERQLDLLKSSNAIKYSHAVKRRSTAFISAGIGLAGLVFGGVSFGMGNIAYKQYVDAIDSASAIEARDQAAFWSGAFLASAATSIIGSGLAAVVWPWKIDLSEYQSANSRIDAALVQLRTNYNRTHP